MSLRERLSLADEPRNGSIALPGQSQLAYQDLKFLCRLHQQFCMIDS